MVHSNSKIRSLSIFFQIRQEDKFYVASRTYRSALSLIRGLLEYGNTSFRSFSLGLQNMLIFIHLEFDAVCYNLLWVEIINEGVSVYSYIFTRYLLNFNLI